MRTLPLFRYGLIAVLAASSVAQARHERDQPTVRPIMLSEHPSNGTHSIYVKGRIVTTLRFEQMIDASKTKMIGWEGRLEPLAVVRNKVILEPIHDLDRDEGIPLVVTLADGTEIPFLVKPPWSKRDGGWPPILDQQVDVFKDRGSHASMHAALMDALKKNDTLAEENERYRKEENSVDHAYATLLVNGQRKKTPFRRRFVYRPKNEDMDMVVEVFAGPGKAAALVTLKNTYYGGPWEFDGAYLTRDFTHATARPFALRVDRATIVPGETGRIAVVADKSAFLTDDGQLADLALQIFRGDGLLQVFVKLERTLVQK
ncbi:DUF2381 family protein [Corallococcus macrosporus]|uniref:DUF2381 family protein n=2 Tax=Myxococcaceae TaxID=31 RepID=A0A250K107_9BACT|nr:DUF2381 family protein [Corallococcus macrosporus]AEI68620.1 hypothetical protein LILAB_33695 [Corallococcus macrosporus]ATB49392.1 hypothetical protein MYMAC_005036 [Corallococcus macrosporus DSM 14697]